MTTIVTRSGKGSSLSWVEADANFTNLNDDKIETSAIGVTVQAHSTNLDSFSTVTPTIAGLTLLDDVDSTAQRTTLGLGNVDNTSDSTKNSATVTLTNKTLTTPIINTNINFSGSTGAIQVNGVDKVTIPATGAVTMPGNVVAFSVYQSVATVLSPSFAKVPFNTEEFDIGGFFDATTNSRFQPTVAGYYFVHGAVTSASAATVLQVQIYKNGTSYKYGEATSGNEAFPCKTAAALVYLNGSTDYVELWATGSAGGNTNPVASLTWFQGHLLGAT